MNFGLALEALKEGKRVARSGWNGKNMYLILKSGETITSEEKTIKVEPCVCMFTAQGTLQPGWTCSQSDMLSEDWEILKD